MPPTGDLVCNVGKYPDQEPNQRSCGFTGCHSLHWATAARAPLIIFFNHSLVIDIQSSSRLFLMCFVPCSFCHLPCIRCCFKTSLVSLSQKCSSCLLWYSPALLDNGDPFWEMLIRRFCCCSNVIDCTCTNQMVQPPAYLGYLVQPAYCS